MAMTTKPPGSIADTALIVGAASAQEVTLALDHFPPPLNGD